MARSKKNPHLGSSFDSFLKEEGIFEEVKATATKRVLQLLLQKGDALTAVREINHFAYFPTPELRAGFIDKCIAAGFKLRRTSEPYKSGAGFGAILFHNDIPDEDALEKIIAMLESIAGASGGEYDGWETQIMK